MRTHLWKKTSVNLPELFNLYAEHDLSFKFTQNLGRITRLYSKYTEIREELESLHEPEKEREFNN